MLHGRRAGVGLHDGWKLKRQKEREQLLQHRGDHEKDVNTTVVTRRREDFNNPHFHFLDQEANIENIFELLSEINLCEN